MVHLSAPPFQARRMRRGDPRNLTPNPFPRGKGDRKKMSDGGSIDLQKRSRRTRAEFVSDRVHRASAPSLLRQVNRAEYVVQVERVEPFIDLVGSQRLFHRHDGLKLMQIV